MLSVGGWQTIELTSTSNSQTPALILRARSAEEPGLQAFIRRVGTYPDREQRLREIISRDRALPSSVNSDGDSAARLECEGQAIPGFHVGHQALELLDALLERRKLSLRVCLEPFLPGLVQVGASNAAHEMEDELLGGGRIEHCVRIRRGFRDVEPSDVDVDLQHRRLTKAQAVERERVAVDGRLILKTDVQAFFAVGHPDATQCADNDR